MKRGLLIALVFTMLVSMLIGCHENRENVDAEIIDIEISATQNSFAFGDSFSFEGIVVTALMSDGSEEVLESTEYSVLCEEYNSMKVGTYQATVCVTGTDISKSYDVELKVADRLKVLMIGNSYADDTINYAYEIAKNVGIPASNILVADIYIGGCSLDTHWANAKSNAPAYRFGLEREGYFDGSSYTNWTMDQAITYADWDFIVLQQNSGNSGVAGSYSNLQKLMDYVMDLATDEVSNPNANPNVKLVWHQTWAYAQNSPNSGFANYNYNQMNMYNAIQSCLQSQVLTKDFVAIIPNGTAIQNARTSFVGDNLTRDEYDHLSESVGRYIASMGLVGTLTGRDMTEVTWKPQDSGFIFTMTDEMIEVCKESWANAMISPYQVTDSKYTPKGELDIFNGSGTQNDPYLIESAEDMWALSELTAGQDFGNGNMYFKLTADIDLSAENWQPICSSSSSGWVENAKSFNANFDGNGKTITFVGNYTGDTWAKGLFSAVGGYVHDLTLRGSITMEKGRVGSLASMATTGARIENITSYVDITASNNQAGGIIGYVAAPNVTITNCANYGTISARSLVGGIVGGSWQNVTYSNCANHGVVTATQDLAGGIVAEKYAAATLEGCVNDGTVTAGGTNATSDTGSADKYAGNLIGKEY